jgi:signal transduction histidine kinase
VLGLLITEPAPLRVANLEDDPDRYGFPPNHPRMMTFLGMPIRVRGEVYGNLYLTDKGGGAVFTDEDEALAEAFALAAGIAIENHRLHEQVRLMSILDDRDRIARDLHDRVIQRVYAVGMSLDGATRLPDLHRVMERIGRAVDELDATITEIRSAIFELGESALPGGLRKSVLHLAETLTETLGVRPEVHFSGAVDDVPQHLGDHVLAVVREGLTNAGKHAGARRYVVEVDVTDRLTVEVIDDGTGIELPLPGSSGLGLVNLRERAKRLGGRFEIFPGPDGGTRLVWSVPLGQPEAPGS